MGVKEMVEAQWVAEGPALRLWLGREEAERLQFVKEQGPGQLASLEPRQVLALMRRHESDDVALAARGGQALRQAAGVVAALRDGPADPDAVQGALARAAREYVHSGWLHAYLHRCFPQRVTGLHDLPALHEHLRLLGKEPSRMGLYACDAMIIEEWQRMTGVPDVSPRYRLGELLVRGHAVLAQEAAEPRPAYGRGRRDLASPEGVEHIGNRLQQRIARFFGGRSTDERLGSDQGEGLSLELMEDGLYLALGPIKLPRFIKELEVRAGTWQHRVLASNVRDQRYRVRVPATDGDYTVAAPGFEDEVREEMSPLRVAGVSMERETVFRIDGRGRGQRVGGAVLAPGEAYRILMPPSSVREVRVPDQEAPLRLTWAGMPPRAYRQGPDRYAVFDPNDRPLARIRSTRGRVVVFLRGTNGTVRDELGEEPEGVIELSGLEPGQYVLEAAVEDTAVDLQRLYFEIAADAAWWPAASAIVIANEQEVVVHGEGVVEADWTELSLAALAPPLWPVRIRWRGVEEIRLGEVHADEEGRVALAHVSQQTDGVRRRQRAGELVLDFGELGCVALRHLRLPDVAALRGQLSELWAERHAALESAMGQPEQLRAVWLERVLEVLGYRLRDLPGGGEPSPHDLASVLLIAPQWRGDMLVLQRVAVLVMGSPAMDLRASGEQAPRSYAARLCERHQLGQVFLTDGLRFARYAAGSRFLQQGHLEQALQDPTGMQMESFLSLFLAEQQA